MSTGRVSCALATTTLAFVISTTASAQDCASAPLLGRRIAAGAHLSHSTLGETSVGATLIGRVVGPLRLGGVYQATRLDNVDQLAQEGRVALSGSASLAGFDVCPTAGAGYMHLSTANPTTEGIVTTSELRLGATIGRQLLRARDVHVTPFVEPILVRRSVSWESIEPAWRVLADGTSQETQLWLGILVARSHNAVVARFRPKMGTEPSEFGVGVVVAFGSP